MGSCDSFERLCRLCGIECYDLINLSEESSHERNLIVIIKKYVRVSVSLQDSLPHHICGPCLAKLDEVVDFVDRSQATQNKFKNQLKECSSGSNVQVNEDHLYELIQDVKVELEESESQYIDDHNDEDYGPHTSKRRRPKTTRGLKGRGVATRGTSNNHLKKIKNKESGQRVDGEKEVETYSKLPSDMQVKTEEWMDSTKSAVRCSLCKTSFSHFEQLTTHSLDDHQLSEHCYMCPQCPQIFHKIASLRNHQRRKHQDSLQGCPQCNKLYPAHYLWTRHMLVHTNTRPFSCDECEKKFKSKAELCNHKRIHRPSEERYTHCCEICGKRFTQKANLESHLRLHTGNRPFSCEFCGKCFSQRGNMEEHRRIHTGEKPFVCDICGVSYSRQGQLAMHRRQHSGEKPHKCQYCEKEFLRREVLRKHEHMHTDTRPYKCSYCEKCFRDQGKRKVHERLHTGERPFKCQFCGRGFCESGNLWKHLRVHQRPPDSTVSSSVHDKDPGLFSTRSEPPGVSSGSSSFNLSSAPNTTTLSIPGVVVAQHRADVPPRNSSGMSVSEAAPHTPVGNHATPQPQNTPETLALHSGEHDHPLGTLCPVEDSQGNCTQPPHQECVREEYRVAFSSHQPASWTLYHT